jgi:hypothetical protein
MPVAAVLHWYLAINTVRNHDSQNSNLEHPEYITGIQMQNGYMSRLFQKSVMNYLSTQQNFKEKAFHVLLK